MTRQSPAQRRAAAAQALAQSAVKLPYNPQAVPAESGMFSTTQVTRLSYEVYKDLEKQVPLRVLPDSPEIASWQNGAEYVLRLLRDGYVTSR